MSELEKLFAAMAAAKDDAADDEDDLPTSIQAKRLGEFFKVYVKACPFEPGDMITARPHSNVSGVGRPHIVLEVCEPRYVWVAEDSRDTWSLGYGRRIDIRVGTIIEGKFAAFWVESFQFEPWTGLIAA